MCFWRKGSNIKVIILLFVCFSLTGCSTFNFFFERLPWLSSWQMSRMFDLNDKQEEEVEEIAEEMKSWFEQEGFPSLVADLESQRAIWLEQPSGESIAQLFDLLEMHNGRFLAELAPKLALLAVTLNEYNLKHYREYIDERKSDWFDSLESDETKQDSRVDRLEDWFGDLNDAQIEIIRNNIFLLDQEKQKRLANNEQWVNEFVLAIEQARLEDIQAWIAAPSVWWTSDYASLRQQNRRQINNAVQELVPTLSEKQIERAADELQEWIENLQEVVFDAEEERAA